MTYSILHIKDVIIETEDCKTFVFQEQFSYQSGQFINVKVSIDGTEHQRSYSLSSSPVTDQHPSITVKRISNGKVSNFLFNNFSKSDKLEASDAVGNFTLSATNATQNIALIGAGSGITPLISLAKTHLKSSANNKVLLLYGNRDENNVILYHTIQTLSEQYPNQFSVLFTYSQPLHRSSEYGRLDKNKLCELAEKYKSFFNSETHFYLCGPDAMMIDISAGLDSINIAPTQISQEHFLPLDLRSKAIPSKVVTTSNERVEERMVTVRYRNNVYKHLVPPNKSILQAFLDKGIQLPYSCQSGVCTACMGQCESGIVKQNDSEGLSQNELNKGFVLTCVAQALTDDVVINID